MDAVHERCLPIFLQFIRFRTLSLEDSVEFHNDMLDIYVDNYFNEEYELIKDSARACMRIGHLMTLADTLFRSSSLLYWILYILDKGVISIELADELILAAFSGLFPSSVVV